jgi:hypothetical protein
MICWQGRHMVAICNRVWGWGAVVWMKGKGESGHAGRELSLARERGAMECFVEMMFESTVFMWLGNYVDVC